MSAGTQIRVMADASSGITATAVVKGATYRLTGLVGLASLEQGAPSTGTRMWLRVTRRTSSSCPHGESPVSLAVAVRRIAEADGGSDAAPDG